ncbi:MAG: response regulator transcription factor [Clostridiales bacterium]|nr:response regulator transcription factor [Clostridiales bacterium]
MRVLLIEDEKRMAQALIEILRQENYEVDWCADGIDGELAAENDVYDIIILDVMLPGRSGFDIARGLRRKGKKMPILMLTARGEIDDKVMGLDSGADDYLTKPFMTKELLARLRALGRRIVNNSDGSLTYGDIALDVGTSLLRCDSSGQTVRLSEKEYRIMEYFLINQGQILTREQLALKIWGYEDEAEYNKVEVYLSFTRKKLSFVGSAVEIKALRGLGYELRYKART